MNRDVIIRSTKYGLDLQLDSQVSFELLLDRLTRRFKDTARFFKNASMALSFSGRQLTREEENQILDIIRENTQIEILCIIDKNEKNELIYKSAAELARNEMKKKEGQFYRGSLVKNQVLESVSSIVILGDIGPGAVVCSNESVIVFGTIYGKVFAGAEGDRAAIVVALSMQASQLCIAGIEAKRQIIYQENRRIKGAKAAFLDGNRIYLDPLVEWSAELK